MVPSRMDLRKAVKHVCYEFQRTQQLPTAMEQARAARDEATVSACFEAFFLHLRNLLEFLDTPKPARISARDCCTVR
jgi:tRNA C32,U32 (ribose-2'-O)-methylase TrmJ